MVLVNGKPADSINTSDRGLNYGDGLFETMVVVDGRVRFFDEHLTRLQEGCQRLAIPMPRTDAIAADLATLVAAQSEAAFVFKVLLTRGLSGRGYLPSKESTTTRVSSRHKLPPDLSELWQNGLVVHVCKARLAINPILAGLKHTNRLEQVLGSIERVDTQYNEGLMLSTENLVVEGTKSNIFWRTGGEFFTPSLENSGVAGVSRAKVIELLEDDKQKVNIGDYSLAEVHSADLVFMTNSTMLVAQVVRLQAGAELEDTIWKKHLLIEELRQSMANLK